MERSEYIVPVVAWCAVLLLPCLTGEAKAQKRANIDFSVSASSLFISNSTHKSFFDGSSFAISYSTRIIDYTDAFIELGMLSAMETDDKQHYGLDKFSISLVNLSLGFDLSLIENASNVFTVGVGGSIRNRKETEHRIGLKLGDNSYLTSDIYTNTMDFGLAMFLKYRLMIFESVTVGVISRFQVYDESHSVFDVGLTLGKKLGCRSK